MSARDELFRRVAGAFVSEDRANKLIDAVVDEAMAELRAERHSTNEALSDAAEQLRVQRDRIAELEAERDAHRAASGCTCIEAPELDAGKLLHSSYCATLINLVPSVPQQRQLEDPHDGPNHHAYVLGRDDLRFIPQQVTGRCPKGHTFEDCTCGGAA